MNSERKKSEKTSIFQQKIPVDRDFWRALRAPTQAEGTLTCLSTPGFRLPAVNVPHTERHLSQRVNDDLVLFRAAADVPGVPLLLLGVHTGVVGDVDIRVLECGSVARGYDGGTPRLRQAHVLHDPIREAR